MDERYRIETPSTACIAGAASVALGGGALVAAMLQACGTPFRPLSGLVVIGMLVIFVGGAVWCRRRTPAVLLVADSRGLAMPWRLWIRGDAGWLVCPWSVVSELTARPAHHVGSDCPEISVRAKLAEADRRRLIAAQGGFARDAAGYVQLDLRWPGALAQARDHVCRLEQLRPR